MITSLVLLSIGFLLIFIEFYLPGAVMGITGGLFVFASLVLFASNSDSPVAIAAFTIGVIAAFIFLVKFALHRIRSAKPDRSILSKATQEGFQASTFNKALLGKIGVVVTDLKPGGHVMIEGERHQAISQGGYLVKGTEVEVLGGQEDSLIVKSVKKEH